MRTAALLACRSYSLLASFKRHAVSNAAFLAMTRSQSGELWE
jgi:hypothetical protein